MDTSDIIAFASMLIAGGAFLYTYLVDKKVKVQELALYEIQLHKHKEEEIASKKAIIEAYVYESTRSRRMKVYNKGQASARNIRFISDDIEKEGSGIFMLNEKILPYPILHPQNSFEIRMQLVSGHNSAPKVKFIWDDDYGENQEREQILNL